MNPETKFWQNLKKRLPGHVMRVENTVTRGVPDVNLCYGGIEIWIELKVAMGGKVLLRKEQFAWGMARSREAGKARVLADMGDMVVYVWHYPNVEVEPCGKYLWIVNHPSARIPISNIHWHNLV